MKSLLSYRTSLLIGCAAFTLITATANAAEVNTPQPSVEVHLEAINNLGHYQPAKTASADDATAVAPKTLKKHGKKLHAHAVAPKAASVETAADAPKPDTSAAKDSTTEPPSLDGAKSASAEPPPLSAAAKLPETASAQPAASGADIPKLAPAELVRTEPAAPASGKKDGALSGLSDLLGGDAKKPADPAKPSAAQATQSLPPVAEVIAPAAPTKDLPPPLSATTPAGPAAADNAPPPLEASKDSKPADKDTDKMILASNEPPSIPDATAKPDAPPPLTASKEAPKEMAQSTLTPLPSNPATPAPAPTAAPTPPAAPIAAAVAPAAAPAAAMTAPAAPTAAAPAPDAAPSGAAPDLRIPFNENETEMPLSASAQLDVIAKTLHDSPNTRINIVGYANGPQTTGIYPKRVSLARGIAVRNYLTTTKGIDIERVNVKAMGNKNAGGPGDRVDIYIVK